MRQERLILEVQAVEMEKLIEQYSSVLERLEAGQNEVISESGVSRGKLAVCD